MNVGIIEKKVHKGNLNYIWEISKKEKYVKK